MNALSSQCDPRMSICLTMIQIPPGTRLPPEIAIQDEPRAPAQHTVRISSHSNRACFDVVFPALAQVGPTRLALADNPYTWEPPGAWVVLFAAQSRSEVGRNLPGGKNLDVVMWTYAGGPGFIKDHPGVRCDRGQMCPQLPPPPVPLGQNKFTRKEQYPSLDIPLTPISFLTSLPFLCRPTDNLSCNRSSSLKPSTPSSFSSCYAPNHDTTSLSSR